MTDSEFIMDDFQSPPNIHFVDFINETNTDTVSSIQAVANVIGGGTPEDIFTILNELSQLNHICPEGILENVLPSLCSNVPLWPQDLQLAAGSQLLAISRSPQLTPSTAKVIALCAIQAIIPLFQVTSALIPQIFLTYGDILVITLSMATWNEEDCTHIFSMVDDYSSSHLPDERLLAVKVLRGLSTSTCPVGLLDTAILPRLWKIFPDRDSFITAHLIATFAKLTSHYSKRKFFDRLWPKFINLWDSTQVDDGYAKSTAISSIADLLSRNESVQLFAAPYQFKLSSYFQHICFFAYNQSRDNINFLPESAYDSYVAVATHLPTLMTYLSNNGALHWHREGLRAYSALSSCNDPSVRAKCALNLPIVCAAYRGKSTSTLTRLAEHFCADEPDVRLAFAQVFQQIIPFLATHSSGHLFKRMLQALLEDSERHIAVALVSRLGQILKALATLRSSRMSELRLLASLEDIAMTSEWRTRETLAMQFGIAAKTFSSRQQDEILMLLRVLFRDGTVPVRKAAGLSFLRVVRMIRVAEERCEKVDAFFDEFSKDSCAIRVSVVETLYNAVEMFSALAFERMFARFLLRMATDTVSNIRLKIARYLHLCAIACQSVAGYDEVIYALRHDDDVDVRTAMIGFTDRVNTEVRNKKRARKDARKLAFERWLYCNRFSITDAPCDDKNERSSEGNVGRSFSRHAFSSAMSKVKRLFGKGKRKGTSEAPGRRPTGKGQLTPSTMREHVSSEDWHRLPDRNRDNSGDDSLDRFDDMSVSTASFGEISPRWFSSPDGEPTPSVPSSKRWGDGSSNQPSSLPSASLSPSNLVGPEAHAPPSF